MLRRIPRFLFVLLFFLAAVSSVWSAEPETCELKLNLLVPPVAYALGADAKWNSIYFFDDGAETVRKSGIVARLRLKDIDSEGEPEKIDLVFKDRSETQDRLSHPNLESESECGPGGCKTSKSIQYKAKKDDFPAIQNSLQENTAALWKKFGWEEATSPAPSLASALSGMRTMGPIDSRTKKFPLPCKTPPEGLVDEEGKSKFSLESWAYGVQVQFEASIKVVPKKGGASCTDLQVGFSKCLDEGGLKSDSLNEKKKTDSFLDALHQDKFPPQGKGEGQTGQINGSLEKNISTPAREIEAFPSKKSGAH